MNFLSRNFLFNDSGVLVSSLSYSVLAITEILSEVLNLFIPLLLINIIDCQTLYHKNIAAKYFGLEGHCQEHVVTE
jgi:hypothetical protein